MDHPVEQLLPPTWAYTLEAIAKHGPWTTGHVTTRVTWPLSTQCVRYRGNEFFLLPSTDELIPAIALMGSAGAEGQKKSRDLISQFASAVVWQEQAALEIFAWSHGQTPVRRTKRRIDVAATYLQLNLVGPEACADERTNLALALYREGLSTNNPFYAALTLFKCLEGFFSDGKVREQWVTRQLALPMDNDAAKRLKELQQSEADVGAYLWHEGRSAIAHAKKGVIANPDVDEDRYRIGRDLPLFRALAKAAIEERAPFLGGGRFKRAPRQKNQFIRDQTNKALLVSLGSGKLEPEAELHTPDSVCLVAHKADVRVLLPKMELIHWRLAEDGVIVTYGSPSGLITQPVYFDVRRHTILPLASHPLPAIPANANRAEVDEIANYLEFVWTMWGNGWLTVFDEERNLVLAQSECLMLRNAILQVNEGYMQSLAAQIAKWPVED